MAKITMTMKPKGGPIILKGITAKMKPRLKAAMRETGGMLTKQIKKHLRETVRHTPSGRRFPSFQSGALFRSVTHQPISGPGVKVGPKTVYAAIHELGGNKIKARPYVFPAWDKLNKKILKMIAKKVTRP